MSTKFSWLAIAAGTALLTTAAHAATLYTNDFSTNADGFTGANALTTSPSGESFLGPLYNGGTATLSLNTAGYSGLNVSFDIYVIGSVDGDGQFGGGPDPFVITDSNSGTIFNYNFANFPGDTQNYPIEPSPADTGAIAIGTLGYTNFPGTIQDSIYAFSLSLPTGASTQIAFSGDTNEALNNEFYGIDNVTVTGTPSTVSAAPEPASWALMVAGVGLIGLTFRYGRRETAVRTA